MEGWSLDGDGLVVYKSGFNAAREPAWGAWTVAAQAAYTLLQGGHYTFHVRARDSQGQVSVYQDSRTLLADVTALQPGIMALDIPNPNATVQQPFQVAGWAIDQAAAVGTGVDAVHVYAYPADASGNISGPPALGLAAIYGLSRPDVGAAFGSQFTNSGYALDVTGLPAGYYHLAIFAHSTVSGAWNQAHRVIRVPTPLMNLETPLEGATVQQPFGVAGWAIDQAAAVGTGVNAVHIYAYPSDASGNISGPPALGLAATYGLSRPDVGAAFGSQFTKSGYALNVSDLPAGFYHLIVFAHSIVTGTWRDAHRIIRVPAS
jgi:hypothetical protein